MIGGRSAGVHGPFRLFGDSKSEEWRAFERSPLCRAGLLSRALAQIFDFLSNYSPKWNQTKQWLVRYDHWLTISKGHLNVACSVNPPRP